MSSLSDNCWKGFLRGIEIGKLVNNEVEEKEFYQNSVWFEEARHQSILLKGQTWIGLGRMLLSSLF